MNEFVVRVTLWLVFLRSDFYIVFVHVFFFLSWYSRLLLIDGFWSLQNSFIIKYVCRETTSLVFILEVHLVKFLFGGGN